MTAVALIRARLGERTAGTLNAGIRYPLAFAFTLGVNLAIALLMQQGHTRIPLPGEEAVPVNVVDMQIEIPSEALQREQQSAAQIPEDLPPVPQPTLPSLEMPNVPASESALKLPDIAGMPSLELCCAVPEVEPAPAPVVSVAAPSTGGDSRGPMLIEPPDLSSSYPYSARQRRIEGNSFIQLVVNADGHVASVEVLRSSPASVFEMAARRVGLALLFQPARRDGKATAARVQLNLHWKLD